MQLRRGVLAAAVVAGLLVTAQPAAAAITDSPAAQSAAQRVAAAPAIPAAFEESVAWSGLTQPVAVRFAPDGTTFVAEKQGLVKRFSGLGDATPETVADVRAATHNYWDRGLIGLAVDPGYPQRPYIYVSYTWDDHAPSWNDGCPTPPGATDDGCVVNGRISRVNVNNAQEQVLLAGAWCQQFPSHSIGGLAFGADGELYASAGDGASFNYADERPTSGRPGNPCNDPAREGGSIRSQDLRTAGDPAGLDGSLLRLDPDTGAAAGGNPLAGSADPNARRIIAQGLRNPFRIAIRPGTNELWAADVGWNVWEEINRYTAPGTGAYRNFGWPCYEGAARLGSWDQLDNPVCEGLYGAGGAVAPYYAYRHADKVVANESCPTGTSSISGLEFYDGGTFPAEYDGALFFADYARSCAWAMLRGADGLPDPTRIRTFITGAPVVDLQVGPGGALFFVDINGTVRRIRALAGNRAPTARATATPASGPAPLAVALDGRGSTDPDGGTLAYAWDLDGDGAYDDGSASTASRTYTTPTTVRLRVRDPSGLEDFAQVRVEPGIPPTAAIAAPAAGTTWKVGDRLAFSGSGTSGTGAPLPASALSWELRLHHCPISGCHVHPVQTWAGTASGTVAAPDHEYPSYLELRLTATDAGLTTSVSRRLDPRTVALTVATDPPGLQAFLGSASGTAPLGADVIVGSRTSLGVAATQQLLGRTWTFTGWPEAGPAARDVVAGDTAASYTAHFATAGGDAPPSGGTAPPAGAPAGRRLDPAALRLHGARRFARGPHGAGLVFDGAGDSATAPALDLSSGFTFAAWVRPARGERRYPVLVAERRRGVAAALGGRRGATDWRKGLRVDAGLRNRRWSHVALTWDGRVARVYVDGRPAGRRARAPRLGRVTRLRLGGDPARGAWLRGRIAGAEVHGRALDAAAVAALAAG